MKAGLGGILGSFWGGVQETLGELRQGERWALGLAFRKVCLGIGPQCGKFMGTWMILGWFREVFGESREARIDVKGACKTFCKGQGGVGGVPWGRVGEHVAALSTFATGWPRWGQPETN